MAINKKLIHFESFENFNSQKLSANKENNAYTLGISKEISSGEPDILYQSIVYIKDTKQQWTHGQLYSGDPFDASQLELSIDHLDTQVGIINDTFATKKELDGRLFIGTREEYNNAYSAGEISIGALVIILDGSESSSNTISLLGTAVLGQMILGNY